MKRNRIAMLVAVFATACVTAAIIANRGALVERWNICALSDNDPTVQEQASIALSQAHSVGAVKPLVGILDGAPGKQYDTNHFAHKAIIAIGLEAIPQLTDCLAGGSRAASVVLRMINEDGALPYWTRGLGHESPVVRGFMCMLIRGKGKQAHALSGHVIRLLYDVDVSVRQSAVWALSEIGATPDAIAGLMDIIVNTTNVDTTRSDATYLLRQLGSEGLKSARVFLHHKDTSVRVAALRGFGTDFTRTVIPDLTEALKDESEEVRLLAKNYLKLIEALSSTNEQ